MSSDHAGIVASALMVMREGIKGKMGKEIATGNIAFKTVMSMSFLSAGMGSA